MVAGCTNFLQMNPSILVTRRPLVTETTLDANIVSTSIKKSLPSYGTFRNLFASPPPPQVTKNAQNMELFLKGNVVKSYLEKGPATDSTVTETVLYL